jgi:cell division protein ZapA
MPNPRNISLDVAIMGREFRIGCPEDEKEGLLQAVSFLDRKMREIRETGKVIGLERIAIMAALNITHDYLSARPLAADEGAARAKLEHLNKLLDAALAQQDNLF